MRQQRVDLFLLLLIIITGTVLRFIYFDRCPYTHDEISSLTRAHYSSFSELIEQGVKPDTHPPLLQIFLQYYTKIFGSSEMVVKFPFVICGILSILLVYLIATKWFGKTAGLLSAAVVSTVQYTVMYSVIARHYSPGLCLTLFLAFCQVKFFETESKNKFWWLAAFTITGVACSYLHYFCLLFTAIIAVTGFLFVDRKNFRQYFIACLLIPLLFIPYLPVFFVQFGYKGIGGPEGWLGAPDSSFFLKYIRYLFHYSEIFLLLVIAAFLFGIARSILKHEKIVTKLRLIALSWFLIPLLTAYFYSVKVNPILQYSILIFSFPYLLMFLFSFIKEVNPLVKIAMVILLLSISTVTLVDGRKHYELFYNQGIRKVISEINNAKQQFGNDSVDAVIEVEDYFLDYYNKNFPLDKNSKYAALGINNDMHRFIKTVSESNKNYFVFGTVRAYPLECLQIMKEYFPNVISEYKGHLTEVFICSKNKAVQSNDETIFSTENTFTEKQNGWNYDEHKVFNEPDDTTAITKYYHYEASDEFGVEFKISLDELIKDNSNILNVETEALMQDSSASPLLVMTMESFDKTVDWRAAKFSDYLKPGERGSVYLSLRFSDIHIDTRNIILKVYVWNKDHSTFNLFRMKVSSEKGNPYFYGLFEEF
jgi:hypothetical protein